MKRSTLLLIVLASVLVLILAACGATEPPPAPTKEAAKPTEAPAATKAPPPTEPPQVELSGDSIRGGLLYDKWWKPLGLDKPEEDHPLWATQSTNERSGDATWRCKECHGWDYKGADGAYGSGSHLTGFVGVLDAAAQGPEYVLGALQGSTSADHDFSSVMDEQALVDLALFIANDAMDYDQFVGADKAAKGGDLDVGETLFGEGCADCHGPRGTAINFKDEAGPEYLGNLSQGNPWEFAHKMRFGQPGEPDMTSAVDQGWTEEEQLAVLAFAQSLPTASPMTEGGQLYDKWWKALGADEPEGDQPLWAAQSTNERSGKDTWRCKECHGWDYKGADGAYGSGSHFTGFPGVLAASSQSVEELTGWLDGTANADHDFSQYLGEDQIKMLVEFMQQGVVDMAPFINDDKTVNGDAGNGQALYNAGCARCHGDDGKEINFKDEAKPEFIGTIANDNPWETFHKAAFGQPGEHMPASINFDWSPEDIADLLAFLQTLPSE